MPACLGPISGMQVFLGVIMQDIQVQISVKLTKRRKMLLLALSAVDAIVQLKVTDKLRKHLIKRSVQVVQVKHEESTSKS